MKKIKKSVLPNPKQKKKNAAELHLLTFIVAYCICLPYCGIASIFFVSPAAGSITVNSYLQTVAA